MLPPACSYQQPENILRFTSKVSWWLDYDSSQHCSCTLPQPFARELPLATAATLLPPCLQPAAFIEIMAPVFSMPFFNGFIAPTLYNAHYGWGLDFIWCV